MERRTLVSTIGAGLVSVSGCFGQRSAQRPAQESETSPRRWGERSYPDVEFYNNTPDTLTVMLRAVADGEQILDETFSIPSGDDTYQSQGAYEEFAGTSAVTVHVSVEDGPTGSHEFEDSKSDSKTLHVDLYPESVQFQESAA